MRTFVTLQTLVLLGLIISATLCLGGSHHEFFRPDDNYRTYEVAVAALRTHLSLENPEQVIAVLNAELQFRRAQSNAIVSLGEVVNSAGLFLASLVLLQCAGLALALRFNSRDA